MLEKILLILLFYFVSVRLKFPWLKMYLAALNYIKKTKTNNALVHLAELFNFPT